MTAFDKWFTKVVPIEDTSQNPEVTRAAAELGWRAAFDWLRIPVLCFIFVAAFVGGVFGYSVRKPEVIQDVRTVYIVTTNSLQWELVGPGGGGQ